LERDVPHALSSGVKNVQEAQAFTGRVPLVDVGNGESVDEEMIQAFSRRRASFFRSAYRFLGNAADAEDAVQEALLSAFRHIEQFRGEAQVSTWLTAIVSNSARMQLRRRTRQTCVSLDEPFGEEEEYSMADQLADSRPSPEDECRNSELRTRLKELVPQLSPSLRRTFELRDLEGLSTNEAAQILGVADGTVKAQLARARAKLKRLMRGAVNPKPRSRRIGAILPSMPEK
jgi:RNA polymerase sigma-70 factor (ECF subfamily)